MDDPEYDDYLVKLGWLDYSAAPGYPRPGHVGEHVYADAWQKLMRTIPRYHEWQVPNGALAQILNQVPGYITQRSATVCSRLACFLGCNCGQGIMLKAADFVKDHHESWDRAYVLSWAIENQRYRWLNHGVRTLEHVMGIEKVKDWLGHERTAAATDLTALDYETAEHFMRWLGSADGRAFTTGCEREIHELEAATLRAKHIGALPPALPSTVTLKQGERT